MLSQETKTLFGRFTSVVAIGFLAWTLTSSTFLDASANFVDKKLDTAKELSDRTTQQLEMLFLHCMR
jgi:hypothetical protein